MKFVIKKVDIELFSQVATFLITLLLIRDMPQLDKLSAKFTCSVEH